MKRISSTSTAFYKKGFPAVWFAFLGVFVALAVTHDAPIMFLLVPCFMSVFGYFLMRMFVWDLADEVYDAGEYLVVKNRGWEYEVPLTDIMNVSSTMAVNPPRITLKLTDQISSRVRVAEVAFSPDKVFSLNPFAKNEIAEDLMARVDKARSRRAV
jgi:hypothetical protein